MVTDKRMLAITLAPTAVAESSMSKGPASGRGSGVHGNSPAASACHMRVDSNEVELRSSPAGRVAGAAAGLALEICAQDVLFELPPGVWTDGLLMAADGQCQLAAVVRYLGAWITASGAHSVTLVPRRPPVHSSSSAYRESMSVSFKAGKRQGMRISYLFKDLFEMLRSMEPLRAAHRVQYTFASQSCGTSGGVVIEAMR